MRYMIFDRWGNPLGDLPYVIKAIRTRATDGTDTLDITTIGEINKDERIAFKDSMGRWAEYLCQSTQTARAAGMPVTVAYCTGSIAELSRTYIEDKRNRNANAKACLAKALEGTRWAVGTVETGTITGTADLAFYHCTVLEAVQKTADTYGLEVQTEYQPDPTGNRIGRRIIHLVEHRGSANTTKRFEYGKDLTQIKRDIDAGDVITRLYGWGKGIEQTNDQGEPTGGYGRKISFADVNHGKPYVQDDQALANWGIPGPDGTRHHSEASVDFPDCEDPKELLTLTKNALKTRATPVVSYTADVTALGQAGLSAEGTDVGDSVQIIDTSFATPLRLEGRILQIEEDLAGSLADTKITLGNIRQSYTQRMAAQQQALDKLVSNSGAWNSAAGGTGPYMKDLIDRINQIMNATGGYTYLKPGQGIYVYDKPEDQTPTQCIHIGGGYWRIADHKKPNGDWDFRALANGKGIFADTVFTGRLSDAAGLNYWDMDTGDFSLSARSTIGGKTVQQYADGAVNGVYPVTHRSRISAGWGDVATIIPWQHYMAYGDLRMLERQYPSMKKWVDYITSQTENDLWSKGNSYGDWVFFSYADDKDGRSAVTIRPFIQQCFYAHSLDLVVRTARLLGRTEDAAKYEALHKRAVDAFRNEYVTPNGMLVSDTQTAYTLALMFDLLPEAQRVDLSSVMARVVRMLRLVAEEKQVDLSYEIRREGQTLASEDEIHEIIYNLTENAIKYNRPAAL